MTYPQANAPVLHHILHRAITVGDGLNVGDTPVGFRRVVPITGGRVSGPLMTGRVLPGGADIQHVVENNGIRTGAAEDIEPVNSAFVKSLAPQPVAQ
jgi:Protein of unknown function (DUF3237)